MNEATILHLLQNAGFKVFGMDSNFVYFEDPSCILPAFDTILNYAWIAILILTAFMLFGWAALYIKNGTNINNIFNNAKSLILVFAVLSVVKPVVNFIYGENLFARGCDTKQVALTEVNKLLEMRNQTFAKSDEAMLYESFDVFDSGAIYNDQDTPYQQNTLSSTQITSVGTSSTQSYSEQPSSQNGTKNSGNTHVEIASNAVIYVNKNGEKLQHIGGSRTWRNNNPGAIRSTTKYGAIGSAGGFAVFPDEATGMQAIVSLLRSKGYNNLSIKDAIHKWAPSSDNNNPASYAKHVSQMTNLAPERKISSLNDQEIQNVARAIRKIEGWKPGQTQRI